MGIFGTIARGEQVVIRHLLWKISVDRVTSAWPSFGSMLQEKDSCQMSGVEMRDE